MYWILIGFRPKKKNEQPPNVLPQVRFEENLLGSEDDVVYAHVTS